MKFRTEIRQTGANTTGIEVPVDVVSALGGGKRPKVTVTLNGYTYRTSIAVMGGVFLMSVSAEVRKNAGVAGGDEVEVEVLLDTEERVVEVPDDLAAALGGAGARERFDRLSYSARNQHVSGIEAAKTPETRQRRIDKAVASLSEGRI